MAEVPMDKDPRKAPPNDYTKPRTKEEIQKKRREEGLAVTPAAKNPPKKKPVAKEKELTFGETLVQNVKSIDKKQVKKHLIFDWFLPELIDQIVGFLKQAFYGDDDAPAARSSDHNGRYKSYGDRYRQKRAARSEAERRNREIRQSYRHIKLTFRDDLDAALEVQDDLREMLEESNNHYVRVKDLYSHPNVGFPTNNTMDNWGWYDLDELWIDESNPDEIALVMPPAEEIR